MIKKLKRRQVYSRYKDNIWEADLADMGLLSSFNRGVKYFLCVICVIDVFSKYPLVDKKAKTVLDGFVRIVNESKPKPNKLWIDQGRQFYNELMKKWLNHNDILMYSTCNEGKSVVAERFIRTLEVETYKKWQHVIVVLILII